MAGVPVLGTLERRPLASRISAMTGILNGTSNYVLSAMHENCLSIEAALRDAQSRGYAEPDPSNDLRGIDAAQKLVVLLHELGIDGRVCEIETVGIDALLPADLQQALVMGGRIKPVAHASIGHDQIEAFVGPTFLREAHPLSRVAWQQNGLRLRRESGCDLFHSGPGAGPGVTAATILDDVLEVVAGTAPIETDFAPELRRVTCRAPATPWFLRLNFADETSSVGAAMEALEAVGVIAASGPVASCDGDRRCWYAITRACSRRRVDMGKARLSELLGCELNAWRALED